MLLTFLYSDSNKCLHHDFVVFKNGKPSKKEYRHFNIKTVVGADDYASMDEIVYRRYHRILEEGSPLPDLIIIDGGKGQVHAAYNSLQVV